VKSGAYIKWRMDVNEIHATFEVSQEGGHHKFVVARDEHVPKVIEAPGVLLEHDELACSSSFAPGLVMVSIFCMGIETPAISTSRRLPYSSYFPSPSSETPEVP
jgi:hypothetical protein